MDINFLEVDSGKILDDTLNLLEQANSAPLYPGDERRIFGEALAMVLNSMFQTINDGCRQRLLRYARGEVLDALGEYRCVQRILPSKAETILQFRVESPQASNVIIPAGVRVTDANSFFFETTKTVVLASGTLFVNAPASSIEGGSQYNGIEIGELNTIVDKSTIPQISQVKNLVMTSGGGNVESDDTYRERIRTAENKLSCGTESSYLFWTLSANPKIVDAAVSTGEELVEAVKPIVDGKVYLNGIGMVEGTLEAEVDFKIEKHDDELVILNIDQENEDETPEELFISFKRKRDGVVVIRPILAGGEVPTEDVLEDVREVLFRPEVKPLTDYVQVVAPDLVFYDIELEYWTDILTEADTIQAIEDPDGAISQYIYWQDSTAGQSINPDQLLKRVLCPTVGTGALRARVIKPEYKELAKTEVAKWSGQLKISHKTRFVR